MSDSWDDLVGSALLGTERRRPSGASGDAEEAAARLLDAAADSVVRRRAGLRPAQAGEPPAPAPRDPRPPLPAAAEHRLATLLASRTGDSSYARHTGHQYLAELLPQWLAAACREGYAAPPQLLPALLDAAHTRTDLRSDALTFAGPRGLWLAGLNPDWRFALRAAQGTALPDDPADARRLWDEGLFAGRVALLSGLRVTDPAAARDLLESSWRSERAEDRLKFLDTLRTGLSSADEDFLEQALSDRSKNVRSTAAELLSALPGSGLAKRMAARARSCVSLGPDGIGVEAPYECDAAMVHDGVVARPPSGRGERAWWLGQLLAATPLAAWRDRFGGRTPEEIVALPVLDDWQGDLHAAWCRAAVRQQDRAWARALLGPATEPAAPAMATDEPAKLLSVLPDGERASWVAAFVPAHGLSAAFQMLGACAVPWAAPLGRAVLDALDAARQGGSYGWSFTGVMGLAERCLDPSAADQVALLGAVAENPPPGASATVGYWAETFQRIARVLRLRALMVAELRPSADAPQPVPASTLIPL